jgi:hypothetical protein
MMPETRRYQGAAAREWSALLAYLSAKLQPGLLTIPKEHRPGRLCYQRLTGVAFFFWVEEFGEARVFLQEGEVFVVAGVKAVFGF